MAFERPPRPAPSINLSALLDVVFILLIFVVLSANFDQLRELEVELPRAHAATATQQDLKVIITSAGDVRIHGELVLEDALRGRLGSLRTKHEGLVVQADGAVAFERAVVVLGEASAAGFHKVAIATRTPSGASP